MAYQCILNFLIFPSFRGLFRFVRFCQLGNDLGQSCEWTIKIIIKGILYAVVVLNRSGTTLRLLIKIIEKRLLPSWRNRFFSFNRWFSSLSFPISSSLLARILVKLAMVLAWSISSTWYWNIKKSYDVKNYLRKKLTQIN